MRINVHHVGYNDDTIMEISVTKFKWNEHTLRTPISLMDDEFNWRDSTQNGKKSERSNINLILKADTCTEDLDYSTWTYGDESNAFDIWDWRNWGVGSRHKYL